MGKNSKFAAIITSGRLQYGVLLQQTLQLYFEISLGLLKQITTLQSAEYN
jgi:hypothetical protein